jgi:hypothetical protein
MKIDICEQRRLVDVPRGDVVSVSGKVYIVAQRPHDAAMQPLFDPLDGSTRWLPPGVMARHHPQARLVVTPEAFHMPIALGDALDVAREEAAAKPLTAHLLQGLNADVLLPSCVARLMPHPEGSTITGITGGVRDRQIVIVNLSPRVDIIVTHEDPSSEERNRFELNGSRATIPPKSSVEVYWDEERCRWHLGARTEIHA